MWAFFWMLVRRSFHGTLRVLEIGEALVALGVHVTGYFVPAHKEELEVAFVALVGLLVLTFFVGLFLAAYAAQREEEEKRADVEASQHRESEKYEAAIQSLKGQLDNRSQSAGAYANLRTLRRELDQIIEWIKRQWPREGRAAELDERQRKAAIDVKQRLLGWFEKSLTEAAKVSLQGFLGDAAEIASAEQDKHGHMHLEFAQAKSKDVDTIIQNLSNVN